MIIFTDKDKAMLKMWDEGATSSEIANHFGVTRNVIMGRFHRLRSAGFLGYKETFHLTPKKFKKPETAPKVEKPQRKTKEENIVGLEAMNCGPWTIAGFAWRSGTSNEPHFLI